MSNITEVDPVGRSIEEMGHETERLRERIEELEEERDACVRQCPAPTIAQAAAMTHGERLYIFTTAQIDAAWKHLEKWHNNPHASTRRVGEMISEALAVEEALRESGIERCGLCEGHKVLYVGKCYDDSNAEEQVCDRCNGHGWVIGGEDE